MEEKCKKWEPSWIGMDWNDKSKCIVIIYGKK
jgi:hypothetical protein